MIETLSPDEKARFTDLRVLVTGANGFIGSHLCRNLSDLGAEVHGISRRHPERFDKGIRWWQADLSDEIKTHQVCSQIRPDVIFHLASHVAGSRDLSLVSLTFKSNLESTVHILTAASEIGCRRVVLAGSLEESEPGDTLGVPCSPYAAAKSAASAYARMFHALYGLPVIVLRLFMVYGPGQQDLRKLIPYVILSLLRKETPKLSSGVRQVDWVYVGDVIDALLRSVLAPQSTDGQAVEIGSGQLVSIRTIVERLGELVDPEIQPLFGAMAERPLERVRVANTAEAWERIGWKPVTSLDDGLQLTADWYRDHFKEVSN